MQSVIKAVKAYIPGTNDYQIRYGLEFARRCCFDPHFSQHVVDRRLRAWNALKEKVEHAQHDPGAVATIRSMADEVSPALGGTEGVFNMAVAAVQQ